MMKYLFLLFLAGQLNAQTTHGNDFVQKIDSLQKLLDQADQVTWQMTDSLDYNAKIARGITQILSDQRHQKYDLAQLLKNDFLQIAHSPDKKLWLFGWHENSGGSFQAAINILYRKSKKPQIVYDEYGDANNHNPEGEFLGYGAYYYRIEKLKSKKNLYLCLGSIIGCNSCCSKIAAVIELDDDKINFDYPAFEKENVDQLEYESAFILDSRCGAISKFEYDAKSQSLVYEYQPNDLTPVTTDDEPGKTISQALVWDGSQFILKLHAK